MNHTTRRLPAPVDLLLAGIAATACIDSRMLNSDGDLARHLRLGEYMLSHRELVRTDFFSFTKPGQDFFPFEWGSEVVLALAHRLGGLPAVSVLAVAVIVATYALMIRFMRRKGVDDLLIVLVVVVAKILGSMHFVARPHLATFLGSISLLFLLESKRRRSLAWVGLLFVAWANLHGGFLYGLLLIGLYLAGDLLEMRRRPRSRDEWRSRAEYHGAALFVGTAATLVNPFGVALLVYVGGFFLGNTFQKDHTQEFLSPNFHLAYGQWFMAVLLVMIASIAMTRRRPALPYLLILVSHVGLALMAIRNISLFGVVAVPIFAVAMDPSWRRLRSAFVQRMRDAATQGRWARGAGPLTATALLALVLVAANGGGVAGRQLLARDFSPNTFPIAAVREARAARLSGRVLSEFTWGGYLLYGWPEQKVFIDGGTDYYGAEIFRSYIGMMSLNPGWRDALREWDISMVLVRSSSAISAELRLDPHWRTWYSDSTATLFRRTGATIAAAP